MNDSPLFGISQRLPPSNLQAEQALLGALLANNKAMDRCEFLSPEHFADAVHGRIFQAIQRRIEAGQLADAVTLKTEFEHSGILHEVGGTAYLAQLLSSMVGIINTGDYARTIHDAWLRRQLIEIGETVVNNAFGAEPDQSAEDIATTSIDTLLRLAEGMSGTRKSVSFAAALDNAHAAAQAAYQSGGAGGLNCGLPSIDNVWGGLWPGELYFLMARSRTGKTPFMLQVARAVAGQLLQEADAAGTRPGHVHIFSLEMTADALGTTNLAGLTEWSVEDIRRGRIGDDRAWMRLDRARVTAGRLPIVIEDQAGMTLPEVIVRARAVARTHRTRLILIDYMELIKRAREHARLGDNQWVLELGYSLKALAKTLGVPILALRQINKSRDNAESTRPTLSDLPYDGGQAADGVFALYRAELTLGNEEPPKFKGTAEVRAAAYMAWNNEREAAKGISEFGVLKRRAGPANVWKKLRFVGRSQLLMEIDTTGGGGGGLLGFDPPAWATEEIDAV